MRVPHTNFRLALAMMAATAIAHPAMAQTTQPPASVQAAAPAPPTDPAAEAKWKAATQQFVTLLTGMGYTPKASDDGRSYYIKVPGKYELEYRCSVSNDASRAWLSTVAAIVPKPQLGRLDSLALLKFTGGGPSFFSAYDNADGGATIELNEAVELAGLAPPRLLEVITSLQTGIFDSESVWNISTKK